MRTDNKSRRAAIVLSGGGAKGAYEVGVLKALKQLGVEADIYCGTSVGSFNCAMLVSGRSVEEIERVWLGLKPGSVFKLRFDPRDLLSFDPLLPLKFAVGSAKMVSAFLSETLKSEGSWWEAIDLESFLIDTSPLAGIIADNVDLRALRASSKELYIAITRLKPVEGKVLEIVSKDKVTHAHILASCSLPFIFPQVTIDTGTFCDGGIVMNSPLKPAIDAGADEIYVLDLTPPPRTYHSATLPLAYQVLSAQFSAALNQDIEYAEELNGQYLAAHKEGRLVDNRLEIRRLDTSVESFGAIRTFRFRYLRLHIIRPLTDLGGIGGFLKFDPVMTARLIEAGRKDALEMLSRHSEKEVSGPDQSVVRAVMRR